MNDRFQFPQSPEMQPSVVFSPEVMTEPTWVEEIKEIEQGIEQLRSNADATTIPRYGVRRYFAAVTHRLLSTAPNETLSRRLIDIESEIGGRITRFFDGTHSEARDKTARRFWYHGGDWFYEVTDQQGPMVSRYQVSPRGLDKLDGAKQVPLADGEYDSFRQLVPLYYQAIKAELYERAKTATDAQKAVIEAEVRTMDEQLDSLLEAPNINEALSKSDFDQAA